jgi:ankyrin repeat protein
MGEGQRASFAVIHEKLRARVLLTGMFCGALVFSCPVAANEAADARLQASVINLDISGIRAALDKGANPNRPTDTKRPMTPLGSVAFASYRPPGCEGAARAARLLISKGAKLGPFDSDILFFPIANGCEPFVALLLDKGASPTRRIEGYTPAEIATKYNQRAIYDLLIARGAVPLPTDQTAQLSLVSAAENGDVARMEAALAIGAHVNGLDASGETPLLHALHLPIMTKEQAAAVWWLLSKGANPNMAGDSEYRDLAGIPLHYFVASNKFTLEGVEKPFATETLNRLLKAGAKVSGMDENGRTPLHIAARFDNFVAAEVLIQEGARVMARDKEGRTPLDYAESARMIKLLKANGAVER